MSIQTPHRRSKVSDSVSERLTVSIKHWYIITWKVENYGFGSNLGKLIYTLLVCVSQVFRGFHGKEESMLKISILRRACKIPSLKFEQQILSYCFLLVYGDYT